MAASNGSLIAWLSTTFQRVLNKNIHGIKVFPNITDLKLLGQEKNPRKPNSAFHLKPLWKCERKNCAIISKIDMEYIPSVFS